MVWSFETYACFSSFVFSYASFVLNEITFGPHSYKPMLKIASEVKCLFHQEPFALSCAKRKLATRSAQ